MENFCLVDVVLRTRDLQNEAIAKGLSANKHHRLHIVQGNIYLLEHFIDAFNIQYHNS